MPLPQHSSSTNSARHFNPYQRNQQQQHQQKNSVIQQQLQQVELGIVSGSTLNPERQPPPPPSSLNNDGQQQTKTKSGLLTKCVDWLFRNPINNKKSISTTSDQQQPQPQQPQQPPLKRSNPPSASSTLIINRNNNNNNQPTQQTSSLFSNHSNYNSLPNHKQNHRPNQTQNDWFRSQSPFVSNHPNLQTSSSSSSLLSLNNHHHNHHHNNNNNQNGSTQITISKSERRRPNTSHATLNIPLSTNHSLSNRVFGNHSTIHDHHSSRIRSLSPLRQINSHRNTLSPSAQIPHSSSFSALGRLTSPNRTLNSTFAPFNPQQDRIPNSPRTPIDLNPPILNQKREHDQMSISPIRDNSPPDRSSVFGGDRRSQSSKRQMFWDPNLGFVTKEHREKMMREAELKLREKEGRPLPTNEAERILEILETGRHPQSLWGNKRHAANLPSIPVPTPSSASSQRTNLLKHINRPIAPGTSLTAIYEEQALHSNQGIIIAPITKKLEAEKIKRHEEKKGKLRAELKKRKLFEENLHKQSRLTAKEDQELNGSTRNDDPTTGLAERKSSRRAQRSASAETTTEPARQRVKSSRKIGKLTSNSSKAKVNQGRKSRSQSVNDEEPNEVEPSTAAPSGRVTRSGRLLPSNGHDLSSKSSDSKRISRSFKNLKSPSPIQEEPEGDHHQQDQETDSDNQSTQRGQPQVDQNTTCLHPTVRSSSVSLQVPLSSLAKSTSTSSLRPGRTFSSRRHIKAKVFSAREEDLPTLNDGEDEEVDEEKEKLKKIKLPSTFLSSFKLEKFNPPPPPQVDVQPEQTQPKQNSESEGSLFNKISAEGPKTSLFGSAPTATPASAGPLTSSSTPTPSIFSKPPVSGFLSAPTDTEHVQQNKLSPFFSLVKDAPTTLTPAGDKVATSQPSSSLDSFSRISSDAPPPNFFGTITSQPSASESSVPKKTDQPEKSSPFSFQPSTTTATTANPSNLFKPSSESNSMTSPFGAQPIRNDQGSIKPSEPQSQSSLLNFCTQSSTQPSTQPTCTNDSVKAAAAPASSAGDSQASSSIPTFSFGGSSNQAVSGFGSQAPTPMSTSAPSQITPAPVSSGNIPSFSFGAQSTATSTTAQPTNTQPPASNGMFDMMDSSSSTTAPSIFGNSAAAPSNPMPISTGFSFGSNLNTNNGVPAAKPELNFGGNSSSTTPSFTFGASTNANNGTGPTQPPGGSLFGAPAPAPSSSSSSTPFTFGAPSGTGSNSNSTSPFVFGAANPSTAPGSTIPTTPGVSGFGLSSSNVATPNNTSSTNIFNFGASSTQQTSNTDGNNSGASVFGSSSASAANNGTGGMFGMMNNNNTLSGNSMNTISGTNTPSFSFGATSSGFGKPTNGSSEVTGQGGLFGGNGFGSKPNNSSASLFGGSTTSNGLGVDNKGMTNNGTSAGLFGQASSVFGGPTASNSSMDLNGGQSMSMLSSQQPAPSIFGAGTGSGHPSSSSSGPTIFGNTSSTSSLTPSFTFSGNPSSSNPVGFGIPSSSTPAPTPNLSTPGGFVFNMGSSTSKPSSAIGSGGHAGPGGGSTGQDGTPIRVTRKLPSSARKTRR